MAPLVLFNEGVPRNFSVIGTIEWQVTERQKQLSKAEECQSDRAKRESAKATEQSEGASYALEAKVWNLIDGTTSRCMR